MKSLGGGGGFMQECRVCGLLFGGGNRCPDCKSIFGSEIEPMDDDGVPSGPLPGASGLADILTEVEGISGPAKEKKPTSNLPFTIGTSRSSESIELPFGTGAQASLRVSMSEPEGEVGAPPSLSEVASVDPMVVEQTLVEETIVEEPESVSDFHPHFDSVEAPQEVLPPTAPIEEDASHPAISVESVVEDNTEDELLISSPIKMVQETDSEDDVVYHDYSEDSNFTEVSVDFDELVDPAEAASSFDPSAESVRLVQMPARALVLQAPFEGDQREVMVEGFHAMQREDWDAAASSFMQLCGERPGDAAAINNHGLCLLQNALSDYASSPGGDPAERPLFHAAILTLRQAAMADREDASIMMNLATALGAAERHETALPIFDAASSLAKEADINLMNNHAVSLQALGRGLEASNLIEAALAVRPDDTILNENLRKSALVGA